MTEDISDSQGVCVVKQKSRREIELGQHDKAMDMKYLSIFIEGGTHFSALLWTSLRALAGANFGLQTSNVARYIWCDLELLMTLNGGRVALKAELSLLQQPRTRAELMRWICVAQVQMASRSKIENHSSCLLSMPFRRMEVITHENPVSRCYETLY
jgi:hypothetical protein